MRYHLQPGDSVRQTMLKKVGQDRLKQLKEQAKIEYAPGVTPPVAKAANGDKAAPDDAEKAGDAAHKKE